MNTAFLHHLSAWRTAFWAACRAERRIAPALDLYCQGLGRAPSAEAIARVRWRRREAQRALAAVLQETEQARRELPLL
jgi:hypothetical protein